MEPWVIYDGNRVTYYDGLRKLCEYAGKDARWCDALWGCMLEDQELMAEFADYLRCHTFQDRVKADGYSMTDLYVQQIDSYNIRQDAGKNTAACNKEEMALDAFAAMAKLRKKSGQPSRRWQDGFGMDKM